MIPRRVSLMTPKYRNKPTEVDGFLFDSKKEAKRYQQLQLLEKAGHVKDLAKQVKYDLNVNGVRIATYTADFVYLELRKGAWEKVVEDVKGYPNDRWPMKKKLMKAIHGVVIRET